MKEGKVKESKKLKVESKSKSIFKPDTKSKSKAKPVKKVEVSSEDSDELDSDDDGGVPLTKFEDNEEVEEESEEEDIPKVADGLHPDRAKVVSTNSMYFFIALDKFQLTLRRPIFKRGTCQTEAISTRTKSSQTISRPIG